MELQGCSVVSLSLLCALLFASVAAMAVRSASEEVNDMEVIMACNKTSPISRELMNSVLINKHLGGGEHSGFKCFLYCLYTKYKWMDDVGAFNLRTMQEVLHQTHLKTHVIEWITYKCSAIPSPDKCERAYKFTECFWAETAKYPEDAEETMQSDENYEFY